MRFKVGDLVQGVHGRYAITNDNMTKGIITDIDKDRGEVTIKILEHKTGRDINESFAVDEYTFDKYFLPLQEENEL